MKIVLSKQQIVSILFSVYFFCEIMFANSIFSQLTMFLFSSASLLMLHNFNRSKYILFYFLFIIWSVINIVSENSENASLSTRYVVTCCINLVFFLSMVTFCAGFESVREFTNIYVNTVIVVCIICLLSGVASDLSGGRLSNLINANKLAVLCSFSSIMTVRNWMIGNDQTKSVIYKLICFFTAILFSGSRKGLIILLLGIYILFCFRKPKQMLKSTMILFVTFFIVGILIFNVEVFYNIIGHRVESFFVFLKESETEEASLMSRYGFINMAWEGSKEKLIMGHGLMSFSLLPRAYGSYSHCNTLEILYSLGIPGVVLYYIPIFWVLIRAVRSIRNNDFSVSLTIALLLPFLICEFMLVTYFMRIYLIIPLICVIFMEKKERRELNDSVKSKSNLF